MNIYNNVVLPRLCPWAMMSDRLLPYRKRVAWTLRTILHAELALSEMHRVPKPGGQLLFIEHGLAPQELVRRWQRRLTPPWSKFAGGCHLDRPIQALIERAGFDLPQLATGHMQGPRPFTFFYEGRARPR